ncbi:hypothetical protein HPP92_024531 [Vanilla planifolia]|uniref:Uncharacterized protein n=1 Tax=Vanilla planifolia TaxID=51239 RepID=A0A835PQW9_VANPL|nr:hypothetical protein HPP92_024524 [Vanilla planifolia]KAG0456743.1 hypothetical protein HPP92_024531 [Vanilla planifolia]
MLGQQASWPANLSFNNDELVKRVETYECSALSLATFASLLIEFVARLQNVVDAFNELSEKAKFKDAVDELGPAVAPGFWTRVKKFIGF